MRRRLPTTLAAAGTLLLAACAGAGPRPVGDPGDGWGDAAVVALVGVNVIPMTEGSGVLANRTVLVRDGRIAQIGAAGEVRVPRRALRVEAAGQYLMPGLADMHVHLEHFPAADLLGLFLASGVTTVRNMDGRPSVLEWKRRVAAGELAGPTILSAGPILDGDPPLRSDNTRIRNADEARAAVQEQAAAGYDWIKVYTNLAPDAYRAVLQAARERGLPVAGHVPRGVALADALAGGQRSVEHLADFDEWVEADSSAVRGRFHWSRLHLAVAVDSARVEAAARRMAAARVWTVPTLVQADRALAGADSVRAWLAAPEMAYLPAEGPALWGEQAARTAHRLDADDWRVVARGRANRLRLLGALRQAGAPVALGTDTPNPFVVPGVSVHQELERFVAAGFSPEQALAAATREAARLAGGLEEWGTVEQGRRADLLLLARNPLEDVGHARSPVGVMVRGRWLPAARLAELLAGLRRRPSAPAAPGGR